LVCAQQAIFPLKELGVQYLFVVGELGTFKTWDKVLTFARGAALKKRIKGMRIGLMGWRAQGMSDMAFDELALREVFGVQIVNVGLTRYTRTVDAIPEPQVELTWQDLRDGFDITKVKEDVARYGIRSYLALKQLQQDENLQAVSVECFHDHLGGPCIGCSKLNDEGIAASCESDVCGAVVMAAGQHLTNEPTFHVDALKVDLSRNSAIWHHCGNLPRRLAEHPDRLGLLAIPEHIGPGAYGPVIQATMKPGPVTVVNLVGRRGNMRICALEGDAISHELEFPGSAAKVIYPFDLAEAFEIFGNAGFGHHFALIQGHVGKEFGAWCKILGIEFLLIDHAARL
jgi:L-fucose isomerase-like protein